MFNNKNSVLLNESSDQKSDNLLIERQEYSSSFMILNSDLSNEIISSSHSRNSSIFDRQSSLNQDETCYTNNKNQTENKKLKMKKLNSNNTSHEYKNSLNYDEFELDSRQELMLQSIGTGSENSATNLHESNEKFNLNRNNKEIQSIDGSYVNSNIINNNKKNANYYQNNSNNDNNINNNNTNTNNINNTSTNKNLKNNQSNKQNNRAKMNKSNSRKSDTTFNDDYASSMLLDYGNKNNNNTNTKLNKNSKKDATIRDVASTAYNAQMEDSVSTLSEKKKKIIVRIVTVFSIIFFLICFAMIAFTLRMSEKIDAQIRKGYSGSNFNNLSLSTKSIHPLLISQFSDSSRSIKNEKVIQKFKLEASEPAQSLSKNANSLLSKIVKNSKILLSSTSLSTTQSAFIENVDISSVINNISK